MPKVIVEENFKGKKTDGKVTIYTDLETAAGLIENGFKLRAFEARYKSKSMEANRRFSFEKPFRRVGTVELDFFEYPEYCMVYYKIFSHYGLSILTFALVLIQGFAVLLWFSKYELTAGSWRVLLPLVVFIGIFVYQRVSNHLFFKRTIKETFKELDS